MGRQEHVTLGTPLIDRLIAGGQPWMLRALYLYRRILRLPIMAIEGSVRESVAAVALMAVAFALFDVIAEVKQPDATSVNVVLALCLLGAFIPIRDLPKELRVLLYYINGIAIFYLAVGYPTHDAVTGHFAADWRPLALAIGAIGFLRPAFVLFSLKAVVWQKELTRAEFPPGISATDYIAVIEVGEFIVCLVLVACVLRALALLPRFRRFAGAIGIDCRRVEAVAFTLGFFAGIGIHLANYFWSGYGKLHLRNAGPLDWALENPTYILATTSYMVGTFTVYDLPFIDAQTALALTKFINVPMNCFVLAIQLLCVLAAFRRRALIVITLLYDLMHVGIFLLTGIFFWKWILLNVGIVQALSCRKREMTFLPIAVVAGAIFTAPSMFTTVILAWFDTGGVNAGRIVAETAAGDRVDVPSNFFIDKSISFAQQDPGKPFDQALRTKTWGVTRRYEIMKSFTDRCDFEGPIRPTVRPEKLADVAQFLQLHHRRLVDLAGEDGRFAYNLYPHHIWSSWLRDQAFRNLDIREIQAYILVVESYCVALADDGTITKRSLMTSEYRVPIDDPLPRRP